MLVIHLVWPVRGPPTALPVWGSHNLTLISKNLTIFLYIWWTYGTLTLPSFEPEASKRSRGSHSTHRTNEGWPESVCFGVSLSKSHKRAVQSPPPVANILPVGENEAHKIGDEWPDKVLEHLVAGLTLKTAWGSQTILKVSSVDKP